MDQQCYELRAHKRRNKEEQSCNSKMCRDVEHLHNKTEIRAYNTNISRSVLLLDINHPTDEQIKQADWINSQDLSRFRYNVRHEHYRGCRGKNEELDELIRW